MKLNHVTIRRTNENECPKHFYFNDGLETDDYIFIDIEQTAQKIGRKIIDDNFDINDICSEEIYAWVEMITDEIRGKLYEEVDSYIYNNL